MVGVVRNARDRAPVEGATVSAEWTELTVTSAGFARATPRLTATTKANGWFALCDLPAEGMIRVWASGGADSTDVIELAVPADGWLRRELFLGPSRASGGIARQSPDVGQLSGTVVSAADNRPVAGARVSIFGGPVAAANDAGEWTIATAPLGTRRLDVRAVGYFPEQIIVDVVPGAPPVRTRLSTMQAVLDTVRITARLDESGFAQRSQTGAGRYMTQEQIARLRPTVPTDLFQSIQGLHIQRLWNGDVYLGMRGPSGRLCAPAVYLDGHYIRGLGSEDINSLLGPDQIAGIEVYEWGTAPAQFSTAMVECGSIVVWTKPATTARRASPLKRRLFALLGAITVGLVFVNTAGN